MKKSNLKSFSIEGLFGDRDVSMKFDNSIKILIGENGLGKTTVLNILYYTLTCKFYKLKEFDFKSVKIVFADKKEMYIEKEMLLNYEIVDAHYPISFLNNLSIYIDNLSPKSIPELNHLLEKDFPTSYLYEKLGLDRNDNFLRRYSPSMLKGAIKEILGYGEGNSKLREAKEIIEREINDAEILYFPTFRRIEEDLINLGLENDNTKKFNPKDSRLIQFGMADVKEKFDELKNEINLLSSRGLSQISSEILSQLVKGLPQIDNMALRRISKNDIDIILARVGNAISYEDKEKITAIFASKKLKEIDDNRYLVYFLQKLITIYEKQREIDTNIEKFVQVCNQYLSMSGKSIEYEASTVDFYLIFKYSSRKVLLTDLLSKLSSGEKQIISLFSKIYLSGNKEFIVLFDEPELSLSLFWQKLLLPDIISSERCRFLLSVTHSPFIFENELDKYAIGLNQYIKFY